MTRLRTAPLRPPARAWRWTLPGLIIALIAGLVWMHALSAGHQSDTVPAAGQVHSSAAADPCMNGDRHTECPVHLPEHPGPICQSGALPAGAAAVTAASTAGVRIEVIVPGPVSAVTAALDRGAGSGRGPPSLTMLSISRT